jgi:hypothetical protein
MPHPSNRWHRPARGLFPQERLEKSPPVLIESQIDFLIRSSAFLGANRRERYAPVSYEIGKIGTLFFEAANNPIDSFFEKQRRAITGNAKFLARRGER